MTDPTRVVQPSQELPRPASSSADPKNCDFLVQRYLDHVRFEKRLAERTCQLYTEDLIKLSALLLEQGIRPQEVSSAHIRQWVVQMNASGRSARGIALILSGWRGFYSWLGREGHIKSNPVLSVKSPKMAKPLPKALSVDDAVQLAQFSDDTKDNEWYNARDAAMVELLYSSGLRVAELVGLDAPNSQHAQHANPRHAANAQVSADNGWLDLQAGEAHVVGKGSKRRTVPIGRQAIAAINTWLTMREDKLSPDQAPRVQALFIGHNGTRLSAQSVWQRLKKRSLQAGLSTPVHPHMLRHSFASHVLQSSSDLRAVQEMLGHANISTTQVYTRLDFQHLAKAYDAAHPRAFKKQSSPSKKTST